MAYYLQVIRTMRDPRAFAAEAHAGQTYGSAPYTVHLAAVAALVASDPAPEAEAIAWLHDALEDTEATAAELQALFGARVAVAVLLVTDPEGHPNRRTRKAALHERLSGLDVEIETFRLALLVKTADRLANVRTCVESGDSRLGMYRKEHRVFRASCYRDGLADLLWAELDALIAGAA